MAWNNVSRHRGPKKYMRCTRKSETGSTAVFRSCGEFTPGVNEGTSSSIFCDVCGVHQSFHMRKDCSIPSFQFMYRPPIHGSHNGGAIFSPALTSLQQMDVCDGEMVKRKGIEKKVRTRINPKKKEVLMAFADKVG